MKKIIIPILFIVIILLTNLSFASYNTVTMSVVEEPICTIKIGQNSKFEKKLISKDLSNKEVTLQLQVTNEETPEKPTGEIVLVIDNSNSMNIKTSSGESRGSIIKSSAKKLVNTLLKDNSNLKIGAVSFSTSPDKNSAGLIEVGTTNDAKKLCDLSSDVSALSSAIDGITYVADNEASYTNLQAGLNLGKQLFTNSQNNKNIIILTDGVPNVILNRNTILYDEDVISATKSEYTSLASSNIKPITMLTGIENGEDKLNSTDTYNSYIQKIFGTPQNPTAGIFYYINDDQIEETVSQDIFKSLMPQSNSLKDITIVDYFPKEIVENFDFAYVSQANIGNISSSIDTKTNSITWTIPELAYGQIATVQYKLKLKENYNSNIVGKILNTNQKVDINYTNIEGQKETKTSDISPKICLEEPPAILPHAGTVAFVTFSIIVIFALAISLIKLIILNNNMKQ